jgi:hypothetical protein
VRGEEYGSVSVSGEMVDEGRKKATYNPGCETDDDNHHDYDCGDCARGETGGFVAFAEEGMISFPGRIGAWENHGD